MKKVMSTAPARAIPITMVWVVVRLGVIDVLDNVE